MTMDTRLIAAGRFKAECLALLDDVAATGEPLVVTKRGRPVARILPVEPPPSLAGSVTYLVDDDELVAPTGESWDAEQA
jgi:prevent-host-death family protein